MSETPPEGRMTLAVILGLFFGGLAAGSLNTARHEYRWRDAERVRGVLVRHGERSHYEYRPKEQPIVKGAEFSGASLSGEGVIDDWVTLDYDPRLPEKLRRHFSRNRMRTNYGQFLLTASAGGVCGVVTLLCVMSFLRALYDKRSASSRYSAHSGS